MTQTPKQVARSILKRSTLSGHVKSCRRGPHSLVYTVVIEIQSRSFNLQWLNSLASAFGTHNLSVDLSGDDDWGVETILTLQDANLPGATDASK